VVEAKPKDDSGSSGGSSYKSKSPFKWDNNKMVR
jgi:hypothetical protein